MEDYAIADLKQITRSRWFNKIGKSSQQNERSVLYKEEASKKLEGFYHRGFANPSHKLKVIQKMQHMLTKDKNKLPRNKKAHEIDLQKLPEQPKIAKQSREKVNVEKIIKRQDSFKELA